MSCKNLIIELKNRTGCPISHCKEALRLCGDNVEIAYNYLKLKSNAVSRWKIVDGNKVPWTNADYVSKASKEVNYE